MDFQTILARYTQSQMINPRKSADFFGGLAGQGSIAAAFTAGLLNARADIADSYENQLAAALKGEQLKLDQQRVSNETSRTQYQNLVDYQNAGYINANADYRSTETGLLKKYGDQKTLADLALSRSQAFQNYAGANASTVNAEANMIGARASSAYTGIQGESLSFKTLLDRQFAASERQTAMDVSRAGISIDQQNAATSRLNADTNSRQVSNTYEFNKIEVGQKDKQLGLNARELDIRQQEVDKKSSNDILTQMREQQMSALQDKAKQQKIVANLNVESQVLDRFMSNFNKSGSTGVFRGFSTPADTRSFDSASKELTDVERPYITNLLGGQTGLSNAELEKLIKRRQLDINYMMQQYDLGE